MLINKNNQQVIINSYEIIYINYELKINEKTIDNNKYILEIYYSSMDLKKGDKIIISDAEDIGILKKKFINKEYEIYEINQDYISVIINIYIENDEIDLEGNGGRNIKLKKHTLSQFLFNYNDTIGKILGFQNVGELYAITEFKHTISNFDDYEKKTVFNEIGNINNINSMLNLTGNNNYMFMYINDFTGVFTNTDIDDCFAKILLSGLSGDIIFNSFIASPLEFINPIKSINSLKITFKYSDNSLPDFRNFNHSFTLRITERISIPTNTLINSNKLSYNQSLIDKHFTDNNIKNVKDYINN
jgi:hypothetical protein